MIAYAIFVLAALHLGDAWMNAGGKARRGAISVFLHVLMQIGLGVATLLMVEPPYDGTPHLFVALAHQAIGLAVLAAVTLQARRLYHGMRHA
jgi:cytochrome c oxidase assembly protein subunit 15